MAKKFRHKFLKSEIFKRIATRLDAWAEIDNLKRTLDMYPTLGNVIPGGDGLRKIRMALPGRGKSGGARIVYFQVVDDCVLLLVIYAKNKQDDLTPSELAKAVNLRDELLAQHMGGLDNGKNTP